MLSNQVMDKYEKRRLALQALADKIGRGAISKIAREIGKEPSYVSRMLYPPTKDGRKRIGEDSVELLNQAYPDWIREEFDSNSSTPPRPILTFSNEDELPIGEYVHLPAIEINLSAGGGQAIWQVDTKGKARAFDARWANRKGIKPGCAATMVVTGNSMNDRLQDGDSVVVDYCRKQILDGKVYAFVWQGEYFIKRLFKEPGGGIRIVSDNQDKVRYPDRQADKEHLGEIEIIGMIVAIAGGDI